MVTESNGSQTITRNSSHFKVIPKHFAQSQENDVKKDDEKTPGIQQNPSDIKDESLPNDPKDLSNLLFEFLTMYKSSMANCLKQEAFFHTFIYVNKFDICKTILL